MPINSLYHTWIRRIQDPTDHPSSQFCQVAGGDPTKPSVCLSRIAENPGNRHAAQSDPTPDADFWITSAIRVRDGYEPIARQWIQSQAVRCNSPLDRGWHQDWVHLQLLIVSLAYRQACHSDCLDRWCATSRGTVPLTGNCRYWATFTACCPEEWRCSWSEIVSLGAVEILRQLDRWHWDYVLRQKTSTHTCLATNLPDLRLALQAYARRMWIEEMFGDLKRHGFDLETTMLRHARRLSRLTLAVALLYVWCIAVGTHTIRAGRRHLVDRKDRRDLSIFQIGLRYLEHQLINGLSFQIPLCCAI